MLVLLEYLSKICICKLSFRCYEILERGVPKKIFWSRHYLQLESFPFLIVVLLNFFSVFLLVDIKQKILSRKKKEEKKTEFSRHWTG